MKESPHKTSALIISGGGDASARRQSEKAGALIHQSVRQLYPANHITMSGEHFYSAGESVDLGGALSEDTFVFNMVAGKAGGRLYRLFRKQGLPQYGNHHTDFASDGKLDRRDHLHNIDISTIPHWRFRHDFDIADDVMYDAILRSVSYPVVVSPLPDNFSADALVVENEHELVEVLEKCFSLDEPVSVSDTYKGNLYRVLILPNFRGQNLYTFPPHELLHEHAIANTYQNHVDVESRPTVNKAAENLAKATFKKLQLRSLATVDVLETEEGDQFVLDVEAHPHISRHSQIQESAHDVGATLKEIFSSVIQSAT